MCPICILRELLYGHKNVIDCSLTSKTVKQDSLWQLYEIKQTAKIYELTIFMYLSFILKQKLIIRGLIFLSGIATDWRSELGNFTFYSQCNRVGYYIK